MNKTDNSFLQQSGKWLHEVGLPAVRNGFAEKLGISSIVLYGHSIGGAIVIVAASYYSDETSSYKLSGLSMSGVGCDTIICGPATLMFEDLHKLDTFKKITPLHIPKGSQQATMLEPFPEYYDKAILQQTERLANPIYLEELYDFQFLWLKYWERYAQSVSVSVMYSMGDDDRL